jgi:16S rRNA G966 N2-methylase RsmD
MNKGISKRYSITDYLRILFERGPIFYWSFFWNNVYFDLKYGTDTYKRKSFDQYSNNTLISENSVWYVGVKTAVLKSSFQIIRRIFLAKKNDFDKYQFVDIGSGKGKSIILFLMQNFSCKYKALGVEFDKDLITVAEENLVKMNFFSRCQLINTDALNTWQFVDSKCLIIYMYNPFSWAIMQPVLEGLLPITKSILLIYIDPVESQNLINCGFELLHEVKGKFPADCFHIYEFSHSS